MPLSCRKPQLDYELRNYEVSILLRSSSFSFSEIFSPYIPVRFPAGNAFWNTAAHSEGAGRSRKAICSSGTISPFGRYIRQSDDCEAGTAANGNYKPKKSFSILHRALTTTLPFSRSTGEHPTLPALRYERSFQAAETLSSPPWKLRQTFLHLNK